MKIEFKWFDIWIGVFIDTKQRKVYICPVPMIVISFEMSETGEKGEG
jgi:hypothetical protein